MKRLFVLCTLALCGSAVVVVLGVSVSRSLSFSDLQDLAASVFFVQSVTTDGLKQKYRDTGRGNSQKIRVLIVPGHDNESWGTEFRGVREADMTAAVGEELSRLLSGDPHYEPILARTRAGYAREFSEYFIAEQDTVRGFVANKKRVMTDLKKTGMVERLAEGVVHNNAASDVVWKLYSINRWANEHNVDIVFHLHFNDYPGRRYNRPGRYDGFALYVPEDQFSNAQASRAVADSLFSQFSKFYAESNFPFEENGIVPDQDLIAIGAYNTLDAASVLIEYGYIYEQKFLDDAIRKQFMQELAFQTYLGLNRFFGAFEEALRKYPTTFLPHEWNSALAEGVANRPSVLSLQAALLLEQAYPPEGKNKRNCPLSGTFGPCTASAVRDFQREQGITPINGVVGPFTLQKLNGKYSR